VVSALSACSKISAASPRACAGCDRGGDPVPTILRSQQRREPLPRQPLPNVDHPMLNIGASKTFYNG